MKPADSAENCRQLATRGSCSELVGDRWFDRLSSLVVRTCCERLLQNVAAALSTAAASSTVRASCPQPLPTESDGCVLPGPERHGCRPPQRCKMPGCKGCRGVLLRIFPKDTLLAPFRPIADAAFKLKLKGDACQNNVCTAAELLLHDSGSFLTAW